MNELLDQIKQMQEQEPQKFKLYVALLIAAPVLFFFVSRSGTKRPPPQSPPRAEEAAQQPGAPAPSGAPGADLAANAALSVSAFIPPEVQAVVAEFHALPPAEQEKYLTTSAAVVVEAGPALAMSELREGVKPDPFRPEVGPGSEVKVAGRPSLLPQLVADVEAARAAGVEVPPILTYQVPGPETAVATGGGVGEAGAVPEGLPDLPSFEGLTLPAEAAAPPPEPPPPPKPNWPWKPRGVIIDADPVAIITNDKGQSLYARVGTMLEPGVEVVAIYKTRIKVRTPDGVEELPLTDENAPGEASATTQSGGPAPAAPAAVPANAGLPLPLVGGGH